MVALFLKNEIFILNYTLIQKKLEKKFKILYIEDNVFSIHRG